MPKATSFRALRLMVPLACCTAMASAPLASQSFADSIELLLRQDVAVASVGERLRIRLVDWCPAGGRTIGIGIGTLSQYGAAYRDAARQKLELGRYPTVTFVIPGGTAAAAGILPGDQIKSIDGIAVAPTDRATNSTADVDRTLDSIDGALADGMITLEILRSGGRLTIPISATPACRARFEVRPGSSTNASTDGKRIQISSDLADPTREAEDIAPLLAHEFSHILLNHAERLRGAYRGVLPGFGSRGRALRDSEIAADRLSVYVLAHAGYRPSDAIAFWTAFVQRTDRGLFSDRTHPDGRRRIAAITAEVDRVRSLQASGRPVVPPSDLFVSPR